MTGKQHLNCSYVGGTGIVTDTVELHMPMATAQHPQSTQSIMGCGGSKQAAKSSAPAKKLIDMSSDGDVDGVKAALDAGENVDQTDFRLGQTALGPSCATALVSRMLTLLIE